MKLTQQLLVIIGILNLSPAFAGAGWYVTIHNNTASDLAITFAGNDKWYCNDFCQPQLVKAAEEGTFYTEEAQPYNEMPRIQGINLNGPYGAHVEFWTAIKTSNNRWKQHAHSVNLNIKQVHNQPEMVYIGTNNLNVTTTLRANPNNGSYGTVYAGVYVTP